MHRFNSNSIIEPQESQQQKVLKVLDEIEKTISSYLHFNEGLKNYLENEQNFEEGFKCLMRLFFNIDKEPLGPLDPKKSQLICKQTLQGIIADLNNFQEIQRILTTQELDKIYLTIHFFFEENKLQFQNPEIFKVCLALYYEKRELNKVYNQFIRESKTLSRNLPHTAETLGLKQMLEALEPYISKACHQFTKDWQFSLYEEGNMLSLLPEKNAAFNSLHNTVRRYKETHTESAENRYLFSLIQDFKTAGRGVKLELNDPTEGQLYQEYLKLFELCLPCYQLSEQITTEHKRLQQPTSSASATNAWAARINKTTKPSCTEQRSRKKAPSSLIEAVIVPLSPVVQTVVEEVKTTEVLVKVESLPGDNAPEQSPSSDLILLEPKAESSAQPLPPNPGRKKRYPNESSFFSQDSKRDSDPLHLNELEQDCFLKIFGERNYDTIPLRNLYNLAHKLGGVIQPTGANRCRLEIKNIYAQLLLSKKELGLMKEQNPNIKATNCNKATVTMHGGGHRKHHSAQSTDAPQYLILQFKEAFKRAGYTPEVYEALKEIKRTGGPTN